MTVYFEDDSVLVHAGDCLDVMQGMPDGSVDAIVTDPPYGLSAMSLSQVSEAVRHWLAGERDWTPTAVGFMGKAWDAFVPPPAVWDECSRVLKPGGHLLAFAGSRTHDLMTLSIRLAGFEIRDSIAYLYGSGFPKSLDVSKAIDRQRDDRDDILAVTSFLADHADARGMSRADVDGHMGSSDMGGWWLSRLRHRCAVPTWEQWERLRALIGFGDEMDAEVWRLNGRKGTPGEAWSRREVVGQKSAGIATPGEGPRQTVGGSRAVTVDITRAATDVAKQWEGWGTALKPSHEPVICAVKPLANNDIIASIGSKLEALEAACRRGVSSAAQNSAPTHHVSPAVKIGSVPVGAAIPHVDDLESETATGAAAGSFEAMDTSVSVSADETFSNTAMSWKACWAELSAETNTSTTSTMTNRTTDLKTLSSCLSQIMQHVTGQNILEPSCWSSLVIAVDNLFAAGVLSSRSIRALSAIGSATGSIPGSFPAAAERRGAFEPIVVARKPLSGTVARNVTQWGTGALNIDACRVNPGVSVPGGGGFKGGATGRHEGWKRPSHAEGFATQGHSEGRWPTNVVLDDAAAREVDRQSGTSVSRSGGRTTKALGVMNDDGWVAKDLPRMGHDDVGGASRFFPVFRYEAKADSAERPQADGTRHPTVKPLDLMRWLIRLVTPAHGLILDPFAGSGTTGEAAVLEHMRAILIEREPEYLPLIKARLSKPMQQGLFGLSEVVPDGA